VVDAAVLRVAPLIDDHAVIGNRGQRERRDEARRVRGENDPHISAGIAQAAHQLRRFVRRDAAGNTEHDVHTVERRASARRHQNGGLKPAAPLHSLSSAVVSSSTGAVSCHFTWFFSTSSIATRVGLA
jgi:hypothetical protein